MELRDYLHFARKSVIDFAKEMGVTRQHMSLIVHKKVKPGKTLCKYIEQMTGGEVTVKDLLGQ